MKQPKPISKRTRGMVLKMIENVWGNLRTPAARKAWAKGQVQRNNVTDQIFRHWLISVDVPGDIARRAWEKGSRKDAIAFLAENADWIKLYRLENEVRKAFNENTPK